MGTPRPGIAELEMAISRMAHLMHRTRRHDEMRLLSGVNLDRAATTVLLQLELSSPIRPGELANLLQVESPHVTRQVQILQRCGYAKRSPVIDDGRAHTVQVTDDGRSAAERIRAVSQEMIATALAAWNTEDLTTIGTLLSRLVEEFQADAEAAVIDSRAS